MRNVLNSLLAFLVGLVVVWYLLQPKEADSQQADPLIDILGIGPAFERALNAAGIYSFRQLGEYTPDELAAKLRGYVTVSAERIRTERWIEQARERR